jgi:hypothetical protein
VWLGHNAATVTRRNCFGWYFFRLKRISEIGLVVFAEAKLFSGPIFRVKIEIQNSISEFASRYGMPAGGIGNGIGRQAARAARPRPDRKPDRPAPPGLAPRPPDRPTARQAGASPEQGRQRPRPCKRTQARARFASI